MKNQTLSFSPFHRCTGYDGGDCCPCTCKLPNYPWDDYYSCKQFACIDPKAQCVDDDDVTIDKLDSCEVVEGIGNGYCNRGNNKPECGESVHTQQGATNFNEVVFGRVECGAKTKCAGWSKKYNVSCSVALHLLMALLVEILDILTAIDAILCCDVVDTLV